MADKKISELTALTSAASDDELAIVDTSASETKKITYTNLTSLFAAKGANSDITSLTGITTPLSVSQGGSGASTLTGLLKGNGTSAFSVAADGTDYISSLVADTTPQLGGELDAQGHSIGFTLQTATGDGTTTIDWTKGNKFKFTFGAANETFTFTAPSKPCSLQLILVQDGTGNRTATFPSSVKWSGGSAPTLSTTLEHQPRESGSPRLSFQFMLTALCACA